MSKIIRCTSGHEAIVDDEDYDWLTAMGNWHVSMTPKGGYVYRKPWKSNAIYIHRLIWSKYNGPIPLAENGRTLEIDHKDNNILNNCKNNLKLCTHKYNVNKRRVKRNKKGMWEKI